MRLADLVSGDLNTLLNLTRRQVARLVIEVLNSGPDWGAAATAIIFQLAGFARDDHHAFTARRAMYSKVCNSIGIS